MLRTLSFLVVVVGAVGCSMTRFAYTSCDTNQQCRDSFGWGFVCNEQQLCAEVKPEPRCETYPTDLIQRHLDFQDSIVVGIQFDKSAFRAEMQAAELALLQVMANDGLDGTQYGFVQCTNEENAAYDAMTQDEANLAMSRYLADEIGVVGMIGPATSSRVNSAFLEVEQFGTLLITPSATSPALTDLDGVESTYDSPGLLWRTVPPDDLQGEVLAIHMRSLGIDRVAAVYENGEYGGALIRVFMEEFEGLGGATVPLPFTPNNSEEFRSAIGKVGAQDAVLFVSSTKDDTARFLDEVVDNTFGTTPIFLADGGQDVELFESVTGIENRLEQISGTAPSSSKTVVYEGFAAEYASKFGESADQTPYTGRAYDAAWLLIYGTAWSHYQESFQGSISGLGAARGLRMISDPNAQQIDVGPTEWNSLRAQFELGNRVNVQGASGALDFDPETGETSSAIDIWSMDEDGSGGLYVSILDTYEP